MEKPKPLLDLHLVVSQAASLEFWPGLENVRIGDDGVSYVVDGAPFEFRFSYTETPNTKPVKEPPFVPFGPASLPWSWTGRNPMPPSKTTVKDFRALTLRPPDEEEVEPVRLASPVLESRDEVLGEPLTKDDINRMIKATEKSSR